MPQENTASSLKTDKTLKTLLEWKAPARLFKKRDKEYFTTLGAIVFLVILILIFIKEWFLILAIIAFSFVTYVLATVRPEDADYKITNKGLSIADKNFFWDDLLSFWFEEKMGQKVCFIQTKTSFPARVMLILGDRGEDEIKKVLSEYIPFEKPTDSWSDKASHWLSEKVPLERED